MIIKFDEGIEIHVDEEQIHDWQQKNGKIILNLKEGMGIRRVEIDTINKSIKCEEI